MGPTVARQPGDRHPRGGVKICSISTEETAVPRIPSRPPLDLSGKWAIVELPSMMDDYLDLTPDPHVLINHTENGRLFGP